MARYLTGCVYLLLIASCGGCGLMRQALSPDLRTLCNEYGVVTIPDRDEEIIFQSKTIDDDDFAQAFKHVKRYGGVKILDLNGQPVSDRSVPLIIQLKKLEVLHVQGTKISLNGLEQLRSLPHLKDLFIEEKHFTEQQLSELEAALPNVEITQTWWIRADGWREPTTRPSGATTQIAR